MLKLMDVAARHSIRKLKAVTAPSPPAPQSGIDNPSERDGSARGSKETVKRAGQKKGKESRKGGRSGSKRDRGASESKQSQNAAASQGLEHSQAEHIFHSFFNQYQAALATAVIAQPTPVALDALAAHAVGTFRQTTAVVGEARAALRVSRRDRAPRLKAEQAVLQVLLSSIVGRLLPTLPLWLDFLGTPRATLCVPAQAALPQQALSPAVLEMCARVLPAMVLLLRALDGLVQDMKATAAVTAAMVSGDMDNVVLSAHRVRMCPFPATETYACCPNTLGDSGLGRSKKRAGQGAWLVDVQNSVAWVAARLAGALIKGPRLTPAEEQSGAWLHSCLLGGGLDHTYDRLKSSKSKAKRKGNAVSASPLSTPEVSSAAAASPLRTPLGAASTNTGSGTTSSLGPLLASLRWDSGSTSRTPPVDDLLRTALAPMQYSMITATTSPPSTDGGTGDASDPGLDSSASSPFAKPSFPHTAQSLARARTASPAQRRWLSKTFEGGAFPLPGRDALDSVARDTSSPELGVVLAWLMHHLPLPVLLFSKTKMSSCEVRWFHAGVDGRRVFVLTL